MHIKKLKGGYAIYHMGKKQTMPVPDKESAAILLKHYQEYEREVLTKNKGMRP